MSATASWAVQVGIVTALRAASAVTSLLGDPGANAILDEVQEGTPYPYIVVGEGSETEELTFGQGGHIVKPDLYIYTEDGSSTSATTGSAGYKQGLAIADAVAQALENDGAFFTVSGHDVTDVMQEEWTKRRLDDPPNTREIAPKFVIHLEDQ